MLLVLRVALNQSVGFESFLAKFGRLVPVSGQIASKELRAFCITEKDFARSLLLALLINLLGTLMFVSYDSIALRVEHVCELILLGLALPLSNEAFQLSALEEVPYEEVSAKIPLLLYQVRSKFFLLL